MTRRCFDLADLLTASGSAMAASNTRMARAGAPALLQEFQLELNFDAGFRIGAGACTLRFTDVERCSPQMKALAPTTGASVSVSATFIAAPSLVPPKEGGP